MQVVCLNSYNNESLWYHPRLLGSIGGGLDDSIDS